MIEWYYDNLEEGRWMQNLGQEISLENGNFEDGKGLVLSWVLERKVLRMEGGLK